MPTDPRVKFSQVTDNAGTVEGEFPADDAVQKGTKTMKKSVTLVRALKEKNCVAGRVEYLRSMIPWRDPHTHELSPEEMLKAVLDL